MATAEKKRQISYCQAPVSPKVKKGGKIVVSEALIKKGATNLVPKVHVKRGDLVMVMSGSEKMGRGKIGKVLQVFPAEGKIIVEGVNIVKRAQKPKSGMSGGGGLIEKEAPIFACKVMLYSNELKKPVRKEHRKKAGIE
jgi:large subunit ribosomal protein L24